jgi:hypothetical protein
MLRYYSGIRLEGLRIAMKTFSQDSRYPGRYFNPGPPKYEAGVFTTRLRRLVTPQLKLFNSVVVIQRKIIRVKTMQFWKQNNLIRLSTFEWKLEFRNENALIRLSNFKKKMRSFHSVAVIRIKIRIKSVEYHNYNCLFGIRMKTDEWFTWSSSYGSTAQFGPWPPLVGFRNNNLFTG